MTWLKRAAWLIPLLVIGALVWLSAHDLWSQLIEPASAVGNCSGPQVSANSAGATTVTAKVLGGQRGEADFGHSLTARTVTINLSLSAVPKGSTLFRVESNQFLREDDAILNPDDVLASAYADGKVLVLNVCFLRNVPGSSLGDPGSYTGSVTLDDPRLSAPLTVPLTVTMQYANGVFLLWLYFAAAIPGAWCVWVLRRPRDGTASALSLDFFKWAGTVGGLVALVSGGIAAFAVYTAVYLRDPTWGSSSLQPLTLYGGMFSAFVTTSGLASLTSQKNLPHLQAKKIRVASRPLRGARFAGSSLQYANLDNANLQDADLTSADPEGVRLEETSQVLAVTALGGNRVIAAYEDRSLREWRGRPGAGWESQLVAALGHKADQLQVTPVGRLLASGEGMLSALDLAGGADSNDDSVKSGDSTSPSGDEEVSSLCCAFRTSSRCRVAIHAGCTVHGGGSSLICADSRRCGFW